jgi:hypothetical protein
MSQIWEIKLTSDTSEEVREAIKLVSRMSFGVNRANGMEYEYLHNMLERYAELLERSAGAWVPVGERLPNLNVAVPVYRPQMLFELWFQLLNDDERWTELNGSPAITPTHWLDVKLPGEQR